jgi:hypothetical protein
MRKRGLSNLVALLLFVFFVIILISSIWFFVIPFLKEQGEVADAKNQLFFEDIEVVSFEQTTTPGEYKLSLERGRVKEVVTGTTEIKTLIKADIVSIADLSGSMNEFWGKCQSSNTPTNQLYLCMRDKVFTQCAENLDSKCIYDYINEKECMECEGETWKTIRFYSLLEANNKLVDNILTTENLNSKRIGLIGFDFSAREQWSHPLSNNINSLKEMINNNWHAHGNTCICCGINKAISTFADAENPSQFKSIILIGNGDANVACTGDSGQAFEDALASAKEAYEEHKIQINTIGLEVSGGNAETELREIARVGNGEYFPSRLEELLDTYNKVNSRIENQIKVLEQTEHLKVVFYSTTGETDIFQIPSSDLPGALERKTYDEFETSFDDIVKIELYLVIKTPSGKLVISDVPQDIYNINQ